MQSTTTNDRISFPPFQLDLAAGRLSRGATTLDLPPKAFGVLRYLAERPGKLVSKEELLCGVWPDVHVSPDVLKVTIAEIRKTLSDPSREPRYIETAHRRGYRFIAPTETSAGVSTVWPETPPTRYARSGDVNIAYQVLGEGSIDLIFVMGWVSHLEHFWTEPSFARFLRRLASFCRLILFDKRGTGLSDRVPLHALPTLEQRMDDVRAVLDAAGSQRAAVCGVSEGGAMSALFAATYPERTSALVMIGSYARRLRDATYPWGPTEADREEFLAEISEEWGGPVGLEERAPSMAADPQFRRWWASYLRNAASPGAAVALTRMNSEADIRTILPAIRVPTLVVHRSADQCLLVDEGRYLAGRIPGARFVELPGADHLPFVGDQDAILDEVEEFVTGVRHTPRSEPVLATLLSASFQLPEGERVSHSRLWPRLHDHIDREIELFRGRACTQRTHYLLASFDGPARALRCAIEIAHHASRLGIQIQAGLHVGECEIGAGRIFGAAVDIARQIEQSASASEILASATVRDLVSGSGIVFQPKGPLGAAGIPLLSVQQDRIHSSLTECLPSPEPAAASCMA
jgi:pimeloyl-ACP methyl ester carboxylesterase/DNA-binding winged helix-turn-helix (wHTH) protein